MVICIGSSGNSWHLCLAEVRSSMTDTSAWLFRSRQSKACFGMTTLAFCSSPEVCRYKNQVVVLVTQECIYFICVQVHVLVVGIHDVEEASLAYGLFFVDKSEYLAIICLE